MLSMETIDGVGRSIDVVEEEGNPAIGSGAKEYDCTQVYSEIVGFSRILGNPTQIPDSDSLEEEDRSRQWRGFRRLLWGSRAASKG